MKYLKSFNESLLYWSIDEEDFDTGEIVKMTSSFKEKISELLLPGFSLSRFSGDRYVRIFYKDQDFFVDIFLFDDEWFHIEYLNTRDPLYGKTMFNSTYYKCDGEEGLFKFLKDEKIIS